MNIVHMNDSIKRCMYRVVHERAKFDWNGKIKMNKILRNRREINEINGEAIVIACKSQIVRRL